MRDNDPSAFVRVAGIFPRELQVTREIYQNICLPSAEGSHCSGNLIKKKQGSRATPPESKVGQIFVAADLEAGVAEKTTFFPPASVSPTIKVLFGDPEEQIGH